MIQPAWYVVPDGLLYRIQYATEKPTVDALGPWGTRIEAESIARVNNGIVKNQIRLSLRQEGGVA